MEEASEEGEGHQGSWANGKSFTDGGCGVAGSIEGVGSVSDLFSHLSHFWDTSCVVADGSVAIDGKTEGKVREHAEGWEGDTVISKSVVGEVGGDCDEDGRDDCAEVAEGESEGDVGGGSGFACVGEFSDGAIGVGCDVFSEGCDDHAWDESEDGA
mgnify:CR=1 FL=1